MLFRSTAANALTSANGVSQLKNITAAIIGADVDGDTVFDLVTDIGANGFILGTADKPFDGLVIVKSGGFDDPTVSVDPFKLVNA